MVRRELTYVKFTYVTNKVQKKWWSTQIFICKISVKFTYVMSEVQKNAQPRSSFAKICEVHLSDERSSEKIMSAEKFICEISVKFTYVTTEVYFCHGRSSKVL